MSESMSQFLYHSIHHRLMLYLKLDTATVMAGMIFALQIIYIVTTFTGIDR